jgi:hypothetical protein
MRREQWSRSGRRTTLLWLSVCACGVVLGPVLRQDPRRAGDAADVPQSIESIVSAAYTREFGVSIPRPVIADATCAGAGHIASTAYVERSRGKARVLSLYFSGNGARLLKASETPAIVLPAGVFDVLTVIVRHSTTTGADARLLWERAQQAVNDDHERLASRLGYQRPIVGFRNITIDVSPAEIEDPAEARDVIAAVRRHGISPDRFTFLILLNLDPANPSGGFARRTHGFVYVGNYNGWQRALTAAQWRRVANTAYHHEMTHHWGWPAAHDWAPVCRGAKSWPEPFVTPPALLGWEDADGDAVPEALDPSPYGRSVPWATVQARSGKRSVLTALLKSPVDLEVSR